MSGNDNPIEQHHAVGNKQRVGDVRPWFTRTQEWLSEPFNFLFATFPIIFFTVMIPALLFVTLAIVVTLHLCVMAFKNVLPYRYPIYEDKDLSTGKKPDGILMLGQTRSKSPYERFKQCFLSNDDLRKHWLIIGATGSGKSETLKGIFFNALCWGAGFFMADGKADNKLPTDGYAMIRAFGRDNSILYLNFLLSGKTPLEVSKSRRRRTNGLNPFYDAEADTIKTMGANLLPKAEGEGKQWQEKALAVYRAVIDAVCYKRDHQGMVISVGVIIDYLGLPKIEELYLEGWDAAKANNDIWPPGFMGIKNYLEVGLPGYSVEKLLRKHERLDQPSSAFGQPRGGRGGQQSNEQTDAPSEQHGYRVGQLMPVLNLLGGTYGHIFGNMFSEIDMIDVALHDRILFLLIPSLEKSAQEAENLGKLTISCLRVMMGKNLGSELEGSYTDLIESKATNAHYPYVVALDELAYYYTEGLAVIFAQARSLGMSMLACSQDLEMLTSGDRAAETGAMLGNAVNKLFMKIDDPNKTWELANKTIGKQYVATFDSYERGVGSGYKRRQELRVQEQDIVTYQEMNALKAGQAVVNTMGKSSRIDTFYVGDWIASLKNQSFHVNRFLQVHPPSEEVFEDSLYCTQLQQSESQKDQKRQSLLLDILTYRRTISASGSAPIIEFISSASRTIEKLYPNDSSLTKGILLYELIKDWLAQQNNPSAVANQDSTNNEHGSAAAALLNTQFEHNLINALDEHGLPDPIALVRKPSYTVLGPVSNDAPNVTTDIGTNAVTENLDTAIMDVIGELPPNSITDEINNLGPNIQSTTQSPMASLLYGYGASTGSELDVIPNQMDDMPAFAEPEPESSLDRIFASQRSLPSVNWVNQSLTNAHRLMDQPRSADDTVVGVTQEALASLRELEQALGSENPAQSAHAMQKVVAAQATPDTIGKGDISDAEIERFFERELDI